nr:Rho termination factor N-terminal domain-containing protein [Actinomycetota bacterium]
MSELGTLERKRLSDLHQIASQLGIEQYRKYRKPELAEMIYKVATEQAASQQAARDGGTTPEQTTNGGADTQESREALGATAEATAEATTDAAPTTVVDGFGEADTVEVEDAAEVEQYREERRTERAQEPPRQRQDRGGRGGEELVQSGILDVLPDGFGFLRTGGYSQSKGDVYVSTSQIKRFNLRRGDYIVGQIRPARDGEKYPAMVRIETINGREPQKGRWRPNFDDLTPLYPMERLRLEWKPNDIAPRVID